MRVLLRLSVVVLGALGPACRSADIQPLAFEQLPVCVATDEAGERVFRSAGQWQDFLRSGRVSGQPVQPDFARVTVATRLDGPGSACIRYTVDDVIASGSRVVVQATRHVFDGPCIAVIAYPQFSVAFDARDLPVSFHVREVVTTSAGEGARACS
jgi:hypothetical protein